VVVGFLSCGHETFVLVGPRYQVGALQGYVLVAGEPRSVTVGAREIDGAGRVIARTRSGEDGWYRLELPTDQYRIEIDPGNNGYLSPDMSDVIRVGANNRRYDVLRGHMTVRVSAPEDLSGEWIEARVRQAQGYGVSASMSTTIETPQTEIALDLLQPGDFRVTLRLRGGPEYWFPGTLDESSSQAIHVYADRETLVDIALTQHASISGSVVGSWQQLERYGPDVEAYNLDMQQVATVRVEDDGTYHLHLVVAEPVKLRVAGYSGIGQWIGGTDFESATIFDPEVGEQIHDVDLVESGIQVMLEGPDTFLSHVPRFLITDDSGWEFETSPSKPYVITNLLPGVYYLHVSHDCSNRQIWIPQWYGGGSDRGTAMPITLGEDQVQTITINLQSGGAIEGQVLFDSGPYGLGVGLFDTEGVALCDNDWSHHTEEGIFSFVGLADGEYLVAVTAGNDRWWYPGTRDIGSASVIRVEDAQTVSGVIWSVETP
jgi:hypothetical protein